MNTHSFNRPPLRALLTALLFCSFAGALVSGCASTARQTETLLTSPRDLPEFAKVPNVPFIEQTENYCGPATLAMVLAWAGKPVTMEELGRDLGGELSSVRKQGTVQSTLVEAARRRGMLAVPIQGLPNLLREVAADHPVIVFENLAFRWFPKYHYAVVHGYDLREEEILLHTGGTASKRWSMRKFERSWELGDYWGLVVLPPERLAASADELAQADAGAALEEHGHLDSAERIYGNILGRWPGSLAALIGLGNIAYSRQDLPRSARHLRMAVKLHPDSATAKANLRSVEKKLGPR